MNYKLQAINKLRKLHFKNGNLKTQVDFYVHTEAVFDSIQLFLDKQYSLTMLKALLYLNI